jgi:hypothetical protein
VKAFGIVSCAAVLVLHSFGQGVKPTKGFVPDAATASRIAEAVLIPIYGKVVVGERPFQATLKDGIWSVTSTRRCQENLPGPMSCYGGHWVRLSKDDGHILQVQAY